MNDRRLGPPQRLPWSIALAAVLALALFVLFVLSVLLGRDWEERAASASAFGAPAGDPAAVVVLTRERELVETEE